MLKLSLEATELIIAHLSKVAPDMRCAACGKDDFLIYNSLTAVPAANLATGDILKEFYPAILTACSNCGCTMQFMPTGELLARLTELVQDAKND